MGIERSTEEEYVESDALQGTRREALPEPLREDISEDEARVAVLHATLEGKSGPVAIHRHTRLPKPLIEHILNTAEFADMVVKAKQNITQSAIDRLTGSVHTNLNILETLRENRDPRVRMEAARDLLNRTPWMAPGAKVEIGTKAYEAAVEKYLIKKDDNE